MLLAKVESKMGIVSHRMNWPFDLRHTCRFKAISSLRRALFEQVTRANPLRINEVPLGLHRDVGIPSAKRVERFSPILGRY